MGDWSQLPNDILRIIGGKLGVGIDRIRFGSVCRTWRSLLHFPQPPWLLLAEDHNTPNTRGFFSLSEDGGAGVDDQDGCGGGGGVYQLELPEIYKTRCIGSTGTWLITIDAKGTRIGILNPFTTRQFDLPPPLIIYHGLKPATRIHDRLLKKVVLFSPPSSPSCIAMAIHSTSWSLAFARPGDAFWTDLKVETPREGFRGYFQDVIFYRNQFYDINVHRMPAVCDLNEAHPEAIFISENHKELDAYLKQVCYLVEWMGELLLVVKFMDNAKLYVEDPKPDEIYYKLDRFEVYKFDFTHRDWNAVDDLGEHSLFLGLNTSVAVLASIYPGLKKNCIYFTDDYTLGYPARWVPGGCCMGAFDLGDGSITPHYKGNQQHGDIQTNWKFRKKVTEHHGKKHGGRHRNWKFCKKEDQAKQLLLSAASNNQGAPNYRKSRTKNVELKLYIRQFVARGEVEENKEILAIAN